MEHVPHRRELRPLCDTGVCKTNTRSKSTRYDSQTPFPQRSMFELWGRGGEDDVMILPCRTSIYFANTCITRPKRFRSRDETSTSRAFQTIPEHATVLVPSLNNFSF